MDSGQPERPAQAPVPRVLVIYGKIITIGAMVVTGYFVLMGTWEVLFAALTHHAGFDYANTVRPAVIAGTGLIFFHLGMNLQRGMRWAGVVLFVVAVGLAIGCIFLALSVVFDDYRNSNPVAWFLLSIPVLLHIGYRVYQHWDVLQQHHAHRQSDSVGPVPTLIPLYSRVIMLLGATLSTVSTILGIWRVIYISRMHNAYPGADFDVPSYLLYGYLCVILIGLGLLCIYIGHHIGKASRWTLIILLSILPAMAGVLSLYIAIIAAYEDEAHVAFLVLLAFFFLLLHPAKLLFERWEVLKP